MESSLQRIVAVIVAVLILFIVPVYIAFEKVDDITYSLLLKQTQTFVDNIRNKGYISPKMYSDFVSEIYALNNNSYDVNIEYTKKRTDPAIYIYEKVKGSDGQTKKGKILYVLDYQKYLTEDGKIPNRITINEKIANANSDFNGAEDKIIQTLTINEWKNRTKDLYNEVTYVDGENCIITTAHVVNEEIITDKQIVNKLFSNTGITKLEFLRQCLLGNADLYNSLSYVEENSYIMNEGDKISVTVKNRNQTIASVFYSMFTANVGFEDVAKIYVNYGGTIKNSGEKMVNTVIRKCGR